MKRFPLFSSIDPAILRSTNREGNIHFLSNKILQSDDWFRYSKWGKTQFLNSLNRGKIPFKNKYYCILCVSVFSYNENVYVFLESGELLLLNDAIDVIINSKYPLAFVFIYCKTIDRSIISELVNHLTFRNLYVVISCIDKQRFLFALACELVNWWGLASSRNQDVYFTHLSKCVDSVVKNYKLCVRSDDFNCESIDLTFGVINIAWSGGTNNCGNTDIDKIYNGARPEQIADTIKRIFDNAGHTRDEHLTPGERLISSQGLFWLAENTEFNDIEKWLSYTRFYSDISGDCLEENVHKSISPRKIVAKATLIEMFLQFIEIPSGEYTIGTSRIGAESEPPADETILKLDKFRILRSPVTAEFWSKVVNDTTIPTNYPLTNLTYFEALEFAQLLNRFFHENELITEDQNLRINLPSEYQWEAAARGPTINEYPWGHLYDHELCNCEMTVGMPSIIGRYSPKGDSYFGCQDMSGNVREWTRSYGGTKGVDWKLHSVNQISAKIPIVPSSRMIIKGGSYSYSADCVVVWMRNTQIASRKDLQTGFRLVLENINDE